jgi:hypothetical protein
MGRLLAALSLMVLHLVAALWYYRYVQFNTADTYFYYYTPANFAHVGFGIGTVFVVKTTQFLKMDLGATYLDCFMMFQAFGFWGLMILMRLFQEIHIKTQTPESVLPIYLLFLPSIHFWTGAIGKDAPLLFAVCLSTWAVMNLSNRMIAFLTGLLVMVLFRAHIAMITVVALAVAALMHGRMTIGRKAMLLIVLVAGAGVLVNAVNSSLTIDVTSAGSVSNFFTERDNIAATATGGTSIGNAAFPIRLFTLLFRPLFIDAGGLLGFVTSLENLGSIALFGFLIIQRKTVRALYKRVFFVRYTLAMSIILILLLALINYNVGLGLRQRVMIMPPLFALLVATWALRPRRVAANYDQFGSALLNNVSPNKALGDVPR